jgi:homoserine kinase
MLGAFLSGAGPSVAVCVEGDPAPVIGALRALYASIDPAVAIRVADIHQPASSTPLALSHR